MAPFLPDLARLGATGPADPQTVWARYTRPALWPTWAPHIREVDYPHSVIVPATTGRVTGMGGLVAVFHVDSVEEDERRWSWSVRSGPLRLAFDHGVDPAPAGSTAWLVTHAPWPVTVAYAPLARLALGRLVSGQPAG
mgnify:CR=1 FL=1